MTTKQKEIKVFLEINQKQVLVGIIQPYFDKFKNILYKATSEYRNKESFDEFYTKDGAEHWLKLVGMIEA